MNRRILTLLAALFPVLILGVLGSTSTVPFVALGPGPTHDTLGSANGKKIVEISGVAVDPATGHLNMTTVAVRDGLTVFEALGFWVSGRHGIVPRAEVYPPGVSREEVDENNKQEFASSENNAVVAALHQLNMPTVIVAHDVSPDGPAKDVLRPGDEFLSVNGKPVATSQDVITEVSGQAPGTVLSMVVRRDGADLPVSVTLGARDDDASKGMLGVTVRESEQAPLKIGFNLEGIGGPSAGLMLSLSLIEQLTPGELNGGRFVAGTGSIDKDGKVGAIGGIPYKMMVAREAGAETFLVPADNCNEARQRVPEGLRLVRVETLAGAVEALENIRAGRDAPSCG